MRRSWPLKTRAKKKSLGIANSMCKVARGAKNLEYPTHGRRPVWPEYHGGGGGRDKRVEGSAAR